MKAANIKEYVDVDALRLGMFVHLDRSWLSHPFPLGSFKITSQEQIATLLRLTERYCVVYQTLARPVPVTTAVTAAG